MTVCCLEGVKVSGSVLINGSLDESCLKVRGFKVRYCGVGAYKQPRLFYWVVKSVLAELSFLD